MTKIKPLLIAAGVLLAVAAGHHHYQQQQQAKQEESNFQADISRCLTSGMFQERISRIGPEWDGFGLYRPFPVSVDIQCERWARYKQKERTGKWWFEEGD